MIAFQCSAAVNSSEGYTVPEDIPLGVFNESTGIFLVYSCCQSITQLFDATYWLEMQGAIKLL